MLSFLKSVVAMTMGGLTLGYVTIAYTVGWDWALAANTLIETIVSFI